MFLGIPSTPLKIKRFNFSGLLSSKQDFFWLRDLFHTWASVYHNYYYKRLRFSEIKEKDSGNRSQLYAIRAESLLRFLEFKIFKLIDSFSYDKQPLFFCAQNKIWTQKIKLTNFRYFTFVKFKKCALLSGSETVKRSKDIYFVLVPTICILS